jgi:hypothetical protein
LNKKYSQETESSLNKLGVYQIVGGAIGALLVFRNIFKTPLLTGMTALLYIFVLMFFAFSIYCGILCLNSNKKSLILSLANQLFQLVGFAVMGFAFKYIAGFYLTIGLDLTHTTTFGFDLGFSTFDFNINNEKEKIEIDINLVALSLIYWMDKLMKKVKDDAAVSQF